MRKSALNKIYLLFLILFSYGAVLYAGQDEDKQIEDILSRMTLRQKIGQLNQLNARTPDEKLFQQIKDGEVGSILNAEDPSILNKLQKIAVEESSLGIPIVFARDVIHGFKTIFPIPLAQAATFDPEVVERGSRVAAIEASENGIRWAFAPMIDISRDPRWGRIAESFGEDTYLSEVMGVAVVKGFQGKDLSNPSSVAACAKHFIGYGAVEGGRDYNVSYISERQLRKTYFPPFERALKDAGCATIMTSFNSNDGVPPSGSKFLLTDVLRDEWKFDGVVVSDWASVSMMVTQGFCEDKKDAARRALNAGLDMDMVSNCYINHLEELVNERKVSVEAIDDAVRNILRFKIRLGLFNKPYTDLSTHRKVYSDDHLKSAQKAAEESFVLLKNKDNILPINKAVKNIAVIGPLADAPHEQMGTWVFDGEKSMTKTPLKALRDMCGTNVNIIYEQTLAFSRDKDKSKFAKAIETARKSDVVLLFVGEESILSGEAHSLADLNLVGAQTELVEELGKIGKPIITIIMAGRPLTIEKEVNISDAVLYAWHSGTMGGPAIAEMLLGKTNPSGKLPVTFPKSVGQIPLYYSYEKIGRPANKKEKLLDQIPIEAKQSSLGNTSYYLDAGFDALFDFGYGLSYTTFEYSNLDLVKSELSKSDELKFTVDLKNTGNMDGCEVVQVYISDVVASVSPSNKELKDFKRINLKAGEKKTVSFSIPISKLAIWNIDMNYVVETGKFKIMVGGDSRGGLKSEFRVR